MAKHPIFTQAKIQRKKFFVGVREGAPVHNITLGGISFPRQTATFRPSSEGSVDTPMFRLGDYVDLSEEEWNRVRAAIASRVVRWTKGKRRGFVYSVDSQSFVPEEDDEPLAPYLYMQMVSEGSTPGSQGPGLTLDDVMPAWEALQDEKVRITDGAKRSEALARKDPRDEAVRLVHAQAKSRGDTVPRESPTLGV